MSAPRTSVLLAAVIAGTLGTAAHAGSIVGLKDGTTLVVIDPAKMEVTSTKTLSGNAALVGIDVRPSDGKLYGVTRTGQIVTIDPNTGAWEAKSQISEKLPEGMISIDFNPAADRMRLISSAGTSLRINVDDGKATVDGSLKYAETDAMKAMTAKVSAAGYTNSVAGTKETALYDIDVAHGVLVKQAPPNDGILNTVGKLGVDLNGPVAFDIEADGQGGNTAWLLAAGQLHTVDLATGAAKAKGKIQGLAGDVTDIAILK